MREFHEKLPQQFTYKGQQREDLPEIRHVRARGLRLDNNIEVFGRDIYSGRIVHAPDQVKSVRGSVL